MINNDSVVTAYDEHLTLVEWLQKVEVLLKNSGLKEITLHDEGSGYSKALFSITLTFNDGTKVESNSMSLKSVNEALNNLNGDINTAMQRIDDLEYEVDGPALYKGFDINQTWNKDNCVRIGTDFSTEEWTLKHADSEITLSTEDAEKARQILSKAIKYGFIACVIGSNNVYGALAHVWEQTRDYDREIAATFILNMALYEAPGFYEIYLKKENDVWKYKCSND